MERVTIWEVSKTVTQNVIIIIQTKLLFFQSYLLVFNWGLLVDLLCFLQLRLSPLVVQEEMKNFPFSFNIFHFFYLHLILFRHTGVFVWQHCQRWLLSVGKEWTVSFPFPRTASFTNSRKRWHLTCRLLVFSIL